jgi:hypothetical protein
VPACHVILADPGTPAYRAALEAVESRVPVNPDETAPPDLYLPAVLAGARIVLPEQSIRDRANPRGQETDCPAQATTLAGRPPEVAHVTRRTHRDRDVMVLRNYVINVGVVAQIP